jgi:hypothetical protein
LVRNDSVLKNRVLNGVVANSDDEESFFVQFEEFDHYNITMMHILSYTIKLKSCIKERAFKQ